jgi:hypothetical protein
MSDLWHLHSCKISYSEFSWQVLKPSLLFSGKARRNPLDVLLSDRLQPYSLEYEKVDQHSSIIYNSEKSPHKLKLLSLLNLLSLVQFLRGRPEPLSPWLKNLLFTNTLAYFCSTATDEVKKFLTLPQPAEELDSQHSVRHLHDGRRRQGRERAVGNGRHLVPVS